MVDWKLMYDRMITAKATIGDVLPHKKKLRSKISSAILSARSKFNQRQQEQTDDPQIINPERNPIIPHRPLRQDPRNNHETQRHRRRRPFDPEPPERRTEARPDRHGHRDAPPRRRVAQNQGDGPARAEAVAGLVVHVLRLDGGGYYEADDQKPVVRYRSQELDRRVRRDLHGAGGEAEVSAGVDEVSRDAALVGAPEVVVPIPEAHQGDTLSDSSEVETR